MSDFKTGDRATYLSAKEGDRVATLVVLGVIPKDTGDLIMHQDIHTGIWDSTVEHELRKA